MDQSPDSLAGEIVAFFLKVEAAVLEKPGQDERELLREIGFADALHLTTKTSKAALFGGESLVPDYIPTDGKSIVECKYIRKNKDGRFNEYDIKNGLAQILEQAVCQKKAKAVFVLLDVGRAGIRDWNPDEMNFVETFKKNPFGIRLEVVRVRIEKEKQAVACQII